MDLLRQLVCAFPARFQDLARLTDTNPELDFFNNVAHLQLHRRSRAFYRLKKVPHLLATHLMQYLSSMCLASHVSFIDVKCHLYSVYDSVERWLTLLTHA